MSLLNLLQSEDPAIQNGLLNFGLALMRSKGNFGNAVGQAGVAGQMGARDFRQQQALMSRTSLNDQLLKNQLEQQQQQMALQKLPQQFMRPASAPGVDATGGMETATENPANAAGPGGFDMQGYIQALAGAPGGGPLAALQMQQMLQKQAPQIHTVGVDQTAYTLGPDGQPRVVMKGASKADKPDKGTPDIQEFMFAQQRGEVPPGTTFTQWLRDNKRAGASSNTTRVSYGAPMAGVDAQGRPVFFQPSKDGGSPAIVPGVQPPPNPAELKRAEESKQAKQAAADKAAMAYQTIDKMLKHPGLDTTIGLSGQIDPRNRVWGTEAQGARALVEQAQGQAFLQAFESLKGGGQITQVEGEKATAAMARLQRAQKAEDFKAAAKELQDIAAKAYERATGQSMAAPPSMPDASAIDAELKRRGR